MKKIIIDYIEDEDGPIECALREVADRIEEGYTHGIIGYSGATWEIIERKERR